MAGKLSDNELLNLIHQTSKELSGQPVESKQTVNPANRTLTSVSKSAESETENYCITTPVEDDSVSQNEINSNAHLTAFVGLETQAVVSTVKTESGLDVRLCDNVNLDETETQSNMEEVSQSNKDSSEPEGTEIVTETEHNQKKELFLPSGTSDTIDAELVSILSKEEITNLLQEYRTELDSTKKKLTKCQRQLEKADNYNEVLRNMVEQLSSELHSAKNTKTCSVHVQVDKDDFLEYTTGRYTMPSWTSGEDTTAMQVDTGETEEPCIDLTIDKVSIQEQPSTEMTTLSIADSVKQAAEAVVQQQQADRLHDQGYVYDETSGLYYHPATGYYYDQEKSLFYDPNTGIYYFYDYNTGEYLFHSQVELQAQTQTVDHTAMAVDIKTSRKKPGGAKRTSKTSKRNKERHLSEEKVFRNRKERRKAEQERQLRQDRRNEDRHSSRYRDKGRDGKRRYSSNSSGSSSSRSRSRSSSLEHGKRSRSDSREEKSHRKRKKHKRHDRKKEKHRLDSKKKKESVENGESDKEMEEENETGELEETKQDRTKVSESEKRSSKSNSDNTTLCRKDLNTISHNIVDKKVAVETEHSNNDNEETNSVKDVNADSKEEIDIADELDSNDEFMIIDEAVSDVDGKDVNEAGDINVIDVDKNSSEEENSDTNKDKKKSERHRKRSHHRSKSRKKSKNHHKKKSKKKKKRKSKKRKKSESDTESGELSNSESEYSSFNQSYSSYTSESDAEDIVIDLVQTYGHEETEMSGSYPPCIRVMVTESDCLDVGSLFIVTCTGSKIGRENCDICIPDVNVSKVHAEIRYNDNSRAYEIFDHASQNGTLLNNQRLSPAKIASEPFSVKHGDCVLIGSTKLLCHIHSGSDTCDYCEPGVVMANYKAQRPLTELKVLSKEERLLQKRQELNQIKKKYGLKNSAYENNPEVFNNPNYTDKAEERRKQVGSDVPGQKQEAPASVHKPISSGNVGHKLLQKMGWKEGESLGKNNSGIQEPISVTLRASQKAGLGSASAGAFTPSDANSVDIKKATRRIQAQQRYSNIDKDNVKTSDDAKQKVWDKGDTEFT